MGLLDEITEEEKQECIKNLTEEGADRLRLGIIQFAIKEYCERIKDGIETESLDRFFDSKWFDVLCEGFGDEIAMKIRKDAKDGIKPSRKFAW